MEFSSVTCYITCYIDFGGIFICSSLMIPTPPRITTFQVWSKRTWILPINHLCIKRTRALTDVSSLFFNSPNAVDHSQTDTCLRLKRFKSTSLRSMSICTHLKLLRGNSFWHKTWVGSWSEVGDILLAALTAKSQNSSQRSTPLWVSSVSQPVLTYLSLVWKNNHYLCSLLSLIRIHHIQVLRSQMLVLNWNGFGEHWAASWQMFDHQ